MTNNTSQAQGKVFYKGETYYTLKGGQIVEAE